MTEPKTLSTTFKFETDKGISGWSGHPDIAVGNPAMIGSNPEIWSPPAILLAATESCFFLTLMALAEKMRVGIKSYSSESSGVLASTDGKHTQFTEITIRPNVVLEDESNNSKLPSLYAKAEEYCYVARSINVPIKVEA